MAKINSEAYISFEKNSNWHTYLSPQIIEDRFVVIEDNCIRYYGENHDIFFDKLSVDFMTGKKENKVLLNKKKDSYSKEIIDELEKQSYLFNLKKNGFSDEQISALLLLYSKIKQVYSDDTIDDSVAVRISNELLQEYNATFQQFFNENLQQVTEKLR